MTFKLKVSLYPKLQITGFCLIAAVSHPFLFWVHMWSQDLVVDISFPALLVLYSMIFGKFVCLLCCLFCTTCLFSKYPGLLGQGGGWCFPYPKHNCPPIHKQTQGPGRWLVILGTVCRSTNTPHTVRLP